jgi:hypothetical protein
MADINKEDIKLLQSQRLDDTPQGGGRMTSHEVVRGQVNNLFPDISRLDKVYGRVSLRKAYPAVLTGGRETYYGSHCILTKQASDPLVSVCFFSDKSWFSMREEARSRMESYLTKGPRAPFTLWADHYTGTSNLSLLTYIDVDAPKIGDVLVLVDSTSGHEQYMRVIEVDEELREFHYLYNGSQQNYTRKIVSVTVGTRLDFDFRGEEVAVTLSLLDDPTQIYVTVPADASRYYGCTSLAEPVTSGTLQLRVTDINTHIVPSASSETGITDAAVGQANNILVQKFDETVNGKISRTLSTTISPNGQLHIGEGVLPGSLEMPAINLYDDSTGNIYMGSNIVGSIDYPTGVINFGSDVGTTYFTGICTYYPAAAPSQVSETAAIDIELNNRGYVYNYTLDPLPEKGSVRVEYLAGGKWYTLSDEGDGHLTGFDPSVGTGTVNNISGTVSVTLGAMPDVGSKVMFFWNKPAEYYDFSGENLIARYKFNLQNDNITRDTFRMEWFGDGNGSGPNGEYAVIDNGSGEIVWAVYTTVWEVSTTWTDILGKIQYSKGSVDFQLNIPLTETQYQPKASENFHIFYNYGTKQEETFNAPPRDGNGHINITLANTPIIPNTFHIEWHTLLEQYDPETKIDMSIDPTYLFSDDGSGNFEGDVDDGTPNWVQGSIDYSTGNVQFHPDRTSVFPQAKYKWVITTYMHPGVEMTRTFDRIEYLSAASLFPTDGIVIVSYCTSAGANSTDYQQSIKPIYIVKESSALELVPGTLDLYVSTSSGNKYVVDIGNGKLYFNANPSTGDMVEVGTINYALKQLELTSDSINLKSIHVSFATATGAIEPFMSFVFRTPGSPLRAGSLQIQATTGAGTLLQATSDFSGNITGTGVIGKIDFQNGFGHVAFGEWVPDDSVAQAQEWYPGAPDDGAGNVWKPFIVHASTVRINCVVLSYLPLDPDLLGLDPVRLPMDGKIPIFRDGYIICMQNELTDAILGLPDNVTSDTQYTASRTNVDELAVYSMPTQYQKDNGIQVCPVIISELDPAYGEYVVDLSAGTVTFKNGYTPPKDSQGTRNDLVMTHKIEDMVLASDVQVTGHISVITPFNHDYPVANTIVSSVLPYGDLQSRAYNEFVQGSWNSKWLDYPEGNPPLAQYNFVDYPITVTNRPSIKERWLILFLNSTNVRVVGEKFGVLIAGVKVISVTSPPVYSPGDASGVYNYDGVDSLVLVNNNFNEPYWVMALDGFGFGWQGGNCIRFNQDAANYPTWFIRTTLQGPSTEATDNYVIQVRGNSS